jgi:pterin-4a-carbinolamine dehydratase
MRSQVKYCIRRNVIGCFPETLPSSSSSSLLSVWNHYSDPNAHFPKKYFSTKHSPWDYTDPNWEKKSKTKYDPTARRPNRLCDPYGQGGSPMLFPRADLLRKTIHSDWIFEMPPETLSAAGVNDSSSGKESTLASITQGPNSDNSDTAENFTSAEGVQRALSNMTKKIVKVVPEKTSTTATFTEPNITSEGSKIFPLFTANEEIQRALASMPPSAPPLPSPPPQSDGKRTRTKTTFFSSQDPASHLRPPPLALVRSFQHPDFLSASRFLHTMAAVAQLNAHYPSLSMERKIIHRHWYVISTVKCHTTVLGGLSTFDFHLALVRLFMSISLVASIPR